MVPISVQFFLTASLALQARRATREIGVEIHSSGTSAELGRVKHLFSDKTGTLTENYFQLSNFVIGDSTYDRRDQGSRAPHVLLSDGDLSARIAIGDEEFRLLMLNLLTNHSAEDRGTWPKSVYVATSPDEEALLYAATAHGARLMFTRGDELVIGFPGREVKAVVLAELPFSSEWRLSAMACEVGGDRWLLLKVLMRQSP